MANSYVDFSFILAEELTTEESQWLDDNTDYEKLEQQEEPPLWFEDEYLGFHLSIESRTAYIYTDDGEGNTDHALELTQEFLNKFRPKDSVIIETAIHCSKPRTGEFGGSAVLVEANRVVSFDPCQMAKVFQDKDKESITVDDLIRIYERGE